MSNYSTRRSLHALSDHAESVLLTPPPTANPLDHLDPEVHEELVAELTIDRAIATAYADLLASVDDEVAK